MTDELLMEAKDLEEKLNSMRGGLRRLKDVFQDIRMRLGYTKREDGALVANFSASQRVNLTAKMEGKRRRVEHHLKKIEEIYLREVRETEREFEHL